MTGKQLGGPTTVLCTDNKAAHHLSYNPELHNRTKHVARRHFYNRDMVEAFELNVPLISTVNNDADLFTKTSKPGSFTFMRQKTKSSTKPIMMIVSTISCKGTRGTQASVRAPPP